MRETNDVLGAFEGEAGGDAPSVAGALRASVPPPAVGEGDARRLEERSARHRVLIMRGGAVVALTTILSIGGALFLHSLFVGIFVLGMLFHWSPGGRSDGDGGRGPKDEEGAGDGYVLLTSAGEESAAPSPRVEDLLGNMPVAVALPSPALAPLPEATAAQLSASELSPVSVPPPAPMPVDLGMVRPQALVLPNRVAGAAAALRVAPPAGTPAYASGVQAGTAARGGGVDDEAPINWLKDGGSGNGAGSRFGAGRGSGNGLDRGFSAGDRPARVLEFDANLHLPDKYQTKRPEKSVIVVVTVLADGSIGGVKIVQSCGAPEIDQMWADLVRTGARFSPELRAGKAVDSEFPMSCSFTPQN